MTPITVEGETLYAAKSIPSLFDCYKCVQYDKNSCVRVRRSTGELYFDGGKVTEGNDGNHLWCIEHGQDMVFINNTPEDIARYVAARLEAS
jgi:hypothetical protein